ncbi:MAG: Lrp/AsnC family transcriptional regulator [Crocinitomicaceae bacterium]
MNSPNKKEKIRGKMAQLDNIDKQILASLQKDGKKTIKEIAGELNMTNSPIFERIKKLESSGIISGYSAKIDSKKLGFQLIAFCSVTLENHHKETIEQFVEDVKELPEILECYHIAGLFDYLLKIVVRDMEDYQHFVTQKLAILSNIARVQSSFVMTEIKNTEFLPLLSL